MQRPMRPIVFGALDTLRHAPEVLDPYGADLVRRSHTFEKAVTEATLAEARHVATGDSGWALLAELRLERALRAGLDLKEALDITDDYWIQQWTERGKARLARIAQLSRDGFLGPVQRTMERPVDSAPIRARSHDLFMAGMHAIRAITKS